MSLTNSSVESTQLREKKINELKGKSIQITYLETKGEKSNEKEKKKQNKKPNTEERIQKLYSNICAIRIPKGKERMRTG